VRGLVKTGLLCAFGVACVNLRMSAKWENEHGATHIVYKKKMGRPVSLGVTKYADVFTKIGVRAPSLT
jgi:hypothetical protein